MRQHGDDVPGVEFEGFGAEVAEGERFVEVRAVDALEGADGLGGGSVVVEGVWECAELGGYGDGGLGEEGK